MSAAGRMISLKHEGTCRVCRRVVAAGARAWWFRGQPTLVCLACRPPSAVEFVSEERADPPTTSTDPASSGSDRGVDGDDGVPSEATHRASVVAVVVPEEGPSAPEVELDRGVAGGSASREFERRHAARDERIRARWGRFGGMAVLLGGEDPQSTRAWARGALGETKLAESLARLKREDIIVLHDRRVPGTRGNIDHLVVAPAGVYIVDAKLYRGEVRIRDVGGFFTRDARLYAGGRDCSKLADEMGWQVDAVRRALADDEIRILPVLCFIDAEWPLFGAPSEFRGVLLEGKRSIRKRVCVPGPLDESAVLAVAAHLSLALPSAAAS